MKQTAKKSVKKPASALKGGVLDVSNLKYKLKNVYVGRKSESALFSMTKGGAGVFNTAFVEKFYGKQIPKKLFMQVVTVDRENIVILSSVKREHFFPVSQPNKSQKVFRTVNKGLFALFGKAGVTMRYSPELVPTTDSSIKAFRMKYVLEDMVKTLGAPNNSFEIHPKQFA